VNLTGFIHDTNPGMGPEVSTIDSGNGFGTRVFWTAVIPDSDVQVNPAAGTAEMHVHNLPELDYFSPDGNAALLSLGPTWQTGYFDSTASFDVVWNGPVTRRVNVKDAANGFAGVFNENQATVTWSTNSTSGFTFTSNPGNFSTSVAEVPGVNGVTAPLNFFAEVGQERNGVFFPAGRPGASAAIIALPASSGLAFSGANLTVHPTSASVAGGSQTLVVLPTEELKNAFAGQSTNKIATAVRAAHARAFELVSEAAASNLFREIGFPGAGLRLG
jgi:hypothetical protein